MAVVFVLVTLSAVRAAGGVGTELRSQQQPAKVAEWQMPGAGAVRALDCPGNAIFGQAPQTSGGVIVLATSELDVNGVEYRRYEHFSGASCEFGIGSIRWWGLFSHQVGGGWEECIESTPMFRLEFWSDDEGEPGDLLCSSDQMPNVTPTGVYLAGVELLEFSTDDGFGVNCMLEAGWIMIQGLGDSDCWFLWLSSMGGDMQSLVDRGAGLEIVGYDLSLCLQCGDPVYGACCEDWLETCTEGVEIHDCLGEGLRYAANQSCADLGPLCGQQTGACCYTSGSCAITTRGVCEYAGGDMNCDGVVNFNDVDPFVLALVSPAAYYPAYPECNYHNGDLDDSGLVNFDDIDPFVTILIEGGDVDVAGTWLGPDTSCDECD